MLPKKYQPEIDLKKLIVQAGATANDETVPLDVLFVGGGPCGLAGAIRLAQLAQQNGMAELQIGVLEKAANLGAQTLSGAVINPRAWRELFPYMPETEYPFRRKVEGEAVYFLNETGQMRIPTPPTMRNHGNYSASLCEVVRFMGKKAEELGVNILTSFPADALLMNGTSVLGVRTTPAGLTRDGQPGSQYMPPTDITAKVTVICDGTRSALSQAYQKWQQIESEHPQIYALGVKEVWHVKKAPKEIIHTMGFPLPLDCFGGSFLYPMADDQIAFGLVVGLDYKPAQLDTHKLLQRLKRHPLFAQFLEGGEVQEWGAKTIPEGGYNSLPKRLHGDGVILAGDAAGFVNVPALKGIHYAMKSGMLAAETIFAALKNSPAESTDTLPSSALKSYDEAIFSSYIAQDLKKVRGMRQAFKSGFYLGGVKAGLMTLTGGAFPAATHAHEDADEPKTAGEFTVDEAHAVSGIKTLSKVDAVYLSGNKTRDDIPQHLTVGKDIPAEVADMYVALCPAGVYERRGDQLVVNAPNCVDCKATDVLGPRWQPREGGSGPNYSQM